MTTVCGAAVGGRRRRGPIRTGSASPRRLSPRPAAAGEFFAAAPQELHRFQALILISGAQRSLCSTQKGKTLYRRRRLRVMPRTHSLARTAGANLPIKMMAAALLST
jgi:hypothetical protein